MKKRRRKAGTAEVASGIRENLEKPRTKKTEPVSAASAESREGPPAKPPATKVWKWARRVVLGYDRRP